MEVDVFASFIICCTLSEQDGNVKISVGGSPLKRGLLLAPSIRSLFVMVTFLFLGRVFGGLRFL
jgi:hypothetical protein